MLKWFCGADEGAAPCEFIIAALFRCCFMGMAGADAWVDVGWWLSLAGECAIPLLDCPPGDPTLELGEVNVRSSMNMLSESAV